jgi:hypothetical protein
MITGKKTILLTTATILLSAAGTLLSAQDIPFAPKTQCGQGTGAGFREDFIHMTTTIEHCPTAGADCKMQMPQWNKPISVRFFADGSDQSKISEVQAITLRSLSEVSRVTQIEYRHDLNAEPNFNVFIMNEAILERFLQSEQNPVNFQPGTYHRAMYDAQSCSGMLWASRLEDMRPGEYQSIYLVAIFVHHSLEGFELESCIYEEVAGAVGLTNDPRGQASLFSDGGYKIVNGQFSYSLQILRMFSAIYEITSGKYTDINDYCNSQY